MIDYKFNAGDKVKLSKEIMDEDLATVIKQNIEEIYIIHDTWFDTKEYGVKYKIVIEGWEFWFPENELEEYIEEIDEDCICRKGEQDVGVHESIYYCQDRKSWVLSLETDRYYVVGSEETEIKYCPYCGRKLGDE